MTLAGGEVERLLALGLHLLTAVCDDLRVDVRAQLQQPLDERRLISDHRQTQRCLYTTPQKYSCTVSSKYCVHVRLKEIKFKNSFSVKVV